MAIGEDKERITAFVPKEVAKEIKKIAKRETRSKSYVAARLMELGLETFKKQK